MKRQEHDRASSTLTSSHKWRHPLAVALAAALAGGPALAEKSSFQFSQVFPDGGQIDGFVIGEDLDGDGRLYSMASFIGDFLGQPAGDEVDYMIVHFRNFQGRSFTEVYDKSVAGIEDDANVFMGVAYNLDGGPLGDDENEGLSLAPLAPSTSYIMGPLFTPASAVGREAYGPCGNAESLPCADVLTLNPVDPFPSFELLFDTSSAGAAPTTTSLRFEFRQAFEGGGQVSGVVSGSDRDGDGRLSTITPLVADFFPLEVSDDVDYFHNTLTDFDGATISQSVDRTVNALGDFAIAFTAIDYDLTGRFVGDDEGEIILQGPLAPSTSWQVGTTIPLGATIPGVEGGLCGNEEGLPCAFVATVTPSETNPPPAVDILFSDLSGQLVEMVPAPLVADGEFSGSWFDPATAGEGFTIEALADGRVIIYWYTYTEDGGQRWFFGEARREGLSLIVDELLVTEGGMFGPMFDPDAVERTPVGTLRMDFAGCNSGTASFSVGDVEGSLDIIRLTRSHGLSCHGTEGTERVAG